MPKLYTNTKLPYLLFACHGLLALVFLFYYGYNTSGEGKKFILETQSIISGETEFVFKYQLLNLSYLLYLLPFVALSIHPLVIILITHLVTLYAYYQFYLLLKTCYNQLVSISWLAGMLLCPLFLYWNFSLYSENLFLALSLLFVCQVFKSKNIASITILGVLLLFCRPAGFFVILLAGLLKLVTVNKVTLKQALVLLTIVCFFGFILIFFFVPLHFDGVAKEIMNGSVICGIPKYRISEFATNQYTLFSAYSFYIGQYGWADFFMIELKKGLSFFNTTRVHYSTFHNAVNLFFSFLFISNVLYFIIALSKKIKANFNAILFIQFYILLNCLLVMLFFNEWTERYTLVVFPFLFLSTALLFNHLSSKENSVI